MRKDRLFLMLFLAAFLFAACDDDDKEERLPDRAEAASPYLRHYFDTFTIPKNMTRIKIPKGDSFDDTELTLNFPMGEGLGVQLADDVRVRLFLIPREDTPDDQINPFVRVIAPSGETTPWRAVDFLQGGTINVQAEVIFFNDLNGAEIEGTWRVQLRDPFEKGGRVFLRNATLRINGGNPTAVGTEDAELSTASALYEARFPELTAPRTNGDLGHFGADAPQAYEFTFIENFDVRAFALSFTIRQAPDADVENDLYACLISPSGGWFAFQIGSIDSDDEESFTHEGPLGDIWKTFVLGLSADWPEVGLSFPFLGEPSEGTWRLLLWDGNKDGNGLYLAPVRVEEDMEGDTFLVPNEPAVLILSS